MEQTVDNPYCPKGWNEHDLKAASMQFNSFMASDAYVWLAHHLECRERAYIAKIASNKPSGVSHGEFIEYGSRLHEVRSFAGAFKTLTGLMNELGKEKPNEKG